MSGHRSACTFSGPFWEPARAFSIGGRGEPAVLWVGPDEAVRCVGGGGSGGNDPRTGKTAAGGGLDARGDESPVTTWQVWRTKHRDFAGRVRWARHWTLQRWVDRGGDTLAHWVEFARYLAQEDRTDPAYWATVGAYAHQAIERYPQPELYDSVLRAL